MATVKRPPQIRFTPAGKIVFLTLCVRRLRQAEHDQDHEELSCRGKNDSDQGRPTVQIKPPASRIPPAALFLAAIFLATPRAEPAEPARQPDDAKTVAWVRFVDSPERYADVPYLFLGRGEIRLTIDVQPQSGHSLELLWGAKRDQREAELVVNGKAQTVKGGGYDGFRWLGVPLAGPPSGQRYEVTIRRGAGKPAFLAEIRLIAPGGAGVTRLDLKQPSRKIALSWSGGVARRPSPDSYPEAFPELRAVWDGEAPASAHPLADATLEAAFRLAEKNGRRANEMYFRCHKFVEGWLRHCDPKSGLFPRNLTASRDFWNAKDSAADNYPFMVLTAALTDRALFEGRMMDILRAETRLTSRIDRLPDDFSFSRQGFLKEKPDLDSIIFGGSEYVKDGLIPLTEWLGPSPWSERMIGIIDDVWKHAPIDTPFGKIPTLNFEVNGDLLQACSRLYWFTGDRKYLDWAIRLGDYYLLGNQHPTRNMTSLRLVDHGCEVINGLSELYVAVSQVAPEKKKAYQEPLHAIYDRILEVGRNPDGMLYTSFNPKTGEHSPSICDTWGYDYDGLYTVYLIDKTAAYREAVRKVLSNLKQRYTGHDWGGADGYADSIEGAINLFNREPIPSASEWIDREIRDMWRPQRADGIVEGWHGDGNSARTAIMYALWKTQGFTIQPWRADIRYGAVREGDRLALSLTAEKAWSGKLMADKARHRFNMRLPLDYTRINQFPEWFTADADRRYVVRDLSAGTQTTVSGRQLRQGIPVSLQAGRETRFLISPP
jgi:hypothetical protein